MRLVVVFVLGAFLALACSPPNGTQSAQAQLPGGSRIVGYTNPDYGSVLVLLLNPDGTLRECSNRGDGEAWRCSDLPAIPE